MPPIAAGDPTLADAPAEAPSRPASAGKEPRDGLEGWGEPMGRKAWMAGFKGIPCDSPGWVQLRNRLPEFHHLEDPNTFMYRRFVERWRRFGLERLYRVRTVVGVYFRWRT